MSYKSRSIHRLSPSSGNATSSVDRRIPSTNVDPVVDADLMNKRRANVIKHTTQSPATFERAFNSFMNKNTFINAALPALKDWLLRHKATEWEATAVRQVKDWIELNKHLFRRKKV
jgi:hypothetical protein